MYLERQELAVADAVRSIFGAIPTWAMGPIFDKIRGKIQRLLNDGFSKEEITARVTEARRDKLMIPGNVVDAAAFIETIHELASFKNSLLIGRTDRKKSVGLLAGELAVHGLHGKKFKSRKPGSVGPVRKEISKLFARNPNMTNPEAWQAICENPPKGWAALEYRFGKYLDGPQSKDGNKLRKMEYRRFCNVCAEERKALKA
jgi:hypothetical protein